MELSRGHVKRLRHYWQGRGTIGAVSLTDAIDLDLAAADFIERRPCFGGVYFCITPQGEKALHAQKQLEISARAPHHHMSERLAQHLRKQGRMTWENIEMRVSREDGTRQYVRPDVFSLLPSYNEARFNPVIHEVKVSRPDFLADLANPKKREAYQRLSEQFFYVTHPGLIDPAELPKGCGLLHEVNPGQFEVVSRVKKTPVNLSFANLMGLVLKPGSLAQPFEHES